MTPEQKRGKQGVETLRRVVRTVLKGAAKAGECLGPKEISTRAGIYRDSGSARSAGSSSKNRPMKNMNDSITVGILNFLHRNGEVKRCKQQNGRGGWKMTPKGLAKRG